MFEKLVAFRYLRARRQEKMVSVIATLSFVGIMLGVATLIIVTAVMNGFHKELLGQILGLNGHLRVYQTEAKPMASYEPLVDKLLEQPGIVLAHPIIERQALLTTAQGASAVIVHGIREKDLAQRPLIHGNVKWGDMGTPLGDADVLVGKRLAEKLALYPGAKVTFFLPQGTTTVFGPTPRTKTFVVKGIFEVGMVDYDSGYVFMDLGAAQTFFRLPEACTNIEIFTENLNQADKRACELLEVLPLGYGVLDWQKANTGYFEAIKVERNVMFIILTLIILVAAFNVISSLIMLVKDKIADIAILRTMGSSRGSILRIFMTVGMSIGLTGTFLGGALGVLIAANIENIRKGLEKFLQVNLFQAEIYFLTQVPADLDVSEVLGIMGMAIVLTVCAAFYPAWRASRLDPVESLRQV